MVVHEISSELADKANWFGSNLPFRNEPYRKKGWGHKVHSLCSYQGKLKPAMAHWLVKTFVPEGGSVLDPLGGVGTIALEAAMQGKRSVSNDMSPLAYTVASGKLSPPTHQEAIQKWGEIYQSAMLLSVIDIDENVADFGLNGTVRDFYHKDTLRELLAVRQILFEEKQDDLVVNFIKANLLHILHGNRPYALSRTSHSILPLHPKGEWIYKSVNLKLLERMQSVYASPLPETFIPGEATYGDFRNLTSYNFEKFDCIITSPPFYGMRFDRPNWLRLWFCGWGKEDFLKTSTGFLERQQVTSLDCYKDFFQMAQSLLKRDGSLIMHIGSGGKKRLDLEIASLADPYFKLVSHISESVTDVETHGIKDRGLTDVHHLLFLEKR